MKPYLLNLRLAWSQTILSGNHEEFLNLLRHPLRDVHPITEVLGSLVLKKEILKNPNHLPLAEMCQLAILMEFAGLDGKSLGEKILPLCSFPTLGSLESTYNATETRLSIDLLLRSFGKNVPLIETEDPYFLALEKILPHFPQTRTLKESSGLQKVFATGGEGVSLGAMRSGNVEVVGFGPQVHPLNNPKLFGVDFSEESSSWGSISMNKEIWFEIFQDLFEFRFLGMSPSCPISFVFYVKAHVAKVGKNSYLPRTLRTFSGNSEKVTFETGEDSLSIDCTASCKMEIIPLAGEGCFWASDFLLAFEIPIHDGKISFSLT